MHYIFPWNKKRDDYLTEYKKIKDTNAFQSDEAIKIAILGSHTLDYFAKILSVRLFENGIAAKVWTAPYNQIEAQVFNPHSELRAFNPDIVLVVQELADALGEQTELLDLTSKENKPNLVHSTLEYCKRIVDALTSNSKYIVMISNFSVPPSTVYGSMEIMQKGARHVVREVNQRLYGELGDSTRVVIIDLDAACANAGKVDEQNERFRFLGDVRLSFRQSVMLTEEVVGAVIAVKGKTKKCIVLDLDNTLWGGIIGEDGISGIKVGQTEAVGKAYLEFQKEILKLHKRGIILAINSKNNEQDALEALRNHPEMVLREEHFAAIKANWKDKAVNLSDIAAELNIGMDSMVFIDDDPFNIELVKKSFPQVTTILLPHDASAYPLLIKTLRLFDARSITDEDLSRGKMYSEDKKRRDSAGSFQNYEEFLESLDLKIQVRKADSITIPRISQLSMRTNQFNMTTKRYSEKDVQQFATSPLYEVYWMSVKDRFGDYGLISACIIDKSAPVPRIDSFYMSCRVLGKGIEGSFLRKVLQELKSCGFEKVAAQAIPTSKNQAFLDFYKKEGFVHTGANEYEYNLNAANFVFPKHITWE